MAAQFPVPGEEFEGTYRIEAILGSGGFARVYRAVELGLERKVALKILRPPTNSTQSDSQRDDYLGTLMKRFEREARMLSQLRSPNTVGLYKYGRTEGGLLYMALEFIDGLSLAEILRAGKPLAPERVVTIIRQVLMSLQEAHAMKMLHRDLKPANIMVYTHLGQKDQVKLLDFGIAKLVTDHQNENSKDLTSDGTLVGTPRYMAPEQIQGSDIGPAADVYALGFVAYELLTGERAIKGDSSINIIGKQLSPESFTLPEDAEVPDGLRYVIDKMMEKRIEHRYSDTAEVLKDLDRPGLLEESLPELAVDAFIDIEDVDFDEASIDKPIATAVEALRDDTLDQPIGNDPKKYVVVFIAFVLGLIGVIAIAGGGDEEYTPPPVPDAPVQTITVKPTPKPAEVQLTARLDGAALTGVTVLVNGVEKGVTPLTLTATEIRGAQLVARYKLPDRDETVEDTQEVSDPRDVMFEFDEAVSELMPIEPEPIIEPEPEVKAPKPRPRPRPRPKPTNVYVAPE